VSTVNIDFATLPEEAAAGYASVLRQRSLPAGTVRVSISKLDDALAASALGRTTHQLLVELFGALPDRSADRAEIKIQHDQMWASALSHPAVARHPQLRIWLAEERAAGKLPADLEQRSALLRQTLVVLSQLPATKPVGLAQLGWSALGDTKALTRQSPLRATVLRALSALAGVPAPGNAEERAALFEMFGATANPLVSQALVAGFALNGNGPVTTTLRLHAESGLAVRLTLEQVLALGQEGCSWPQRVFIVENPEVMGATLAELRHEHPALICTEGRPHRAADKLIDMLIAAGADVKAHNDFDWDGLAINRALQERGVQPWRMSAPDLLASSAGRTSEELPVLTGSPVQTPWDPRLSDALTTLGREVHEEDGSVLESLLRDLHAASRRTG
jgi:uncharacterized protein (TIGR02679 family)